MTTRSFAVKQARQLKWLSKATDNLLGRKSANALVPAALRKAVPQLMENISVLIVDDSSVMRKIVERSLRPAGIEIGQVFEAGNGLEALAVLNERKVNLVLCDIDMLTESAAEVCCVHRPRTAGT